MLTADGQVKVLDFGLAKFDEAGGAGQDLTQSPTLTHAATQAGMILGTAAYMSPEQAKGRAADKRSDVWAFGCVLYEMLAGRRAFDGEDATEVIAAVVRAEPDWSAIPADVPAHIRTLVKRCLEKDRKARIGDVAVARFLLDEASAVPSAVAATIGGAASPRWRRSVPWILAGAALAVAALTVATGRRSRPEQPAAPMRLSVEIGGDLSLVMGQGPAASLSPDGKVLVVVAQGTGEPARLHVRHLNQLEATPLAGTEDARGPFFSPDGQWVAFFAGGKLKKISVTGGAPITLGDAPNARGGAWGDDDAIVFLRRRGAV